jgi:EF hand
MTKFKLVFGICMFVLILGVTCSFAQTPADAIKAKGQSLISTMDANKDGLISKEYLAKCKGANCGQRFDALDANKDGILEKAEAQEKAESAKQKRATMKENLKNKVQTGQQPAN